MGATRFLLISFLVLFLTGCVTSRPSPQRSPNDGLYYMTGGEHCALWRQNEPGRIMCYKADETPTGYAYAMTYADMQMYFHRVEQERLAQESFLESLQQFGQSVRASNEQQTRIMSQSIQNMQQNMNQQQYDWSRNHNRNIYCQRISDMVICH